jgi:hypothetical protein
MCPSETPSACDLRIDDLTMHEQVGGAFVPADMTETPLIVDFFR